MCIRDRPNMDKLKRLDALLRDFDAAVVSSDLYKYQHVGHWYIVTCPNGAEPPMECAIGNPKPSRTFEYEIGIMAWRLTNIAREHAIHVTIG